MKLRSVRIHNFRGIKQLETVFDGENTVILGPNGTGKSSLVDAIDFLFTGAIRRLTGQGAGSLSIVKHAVHVDESSSDAWVEADIRNGSGEITTLRRTVKAADDLVVSGTLTGEITSFLSQCSEGSHLLTRREILSYILTEPAKRLEQVAALLQFTEIAGIRRELQGAAKDANDTLRQAMAAEQARLTSALRSFDPPLLDMSDALMRVNDRRALLNGPALQSVAIVDLRREIVPPAQSKFSALQSQRTRDYLEKTAQWVDTTAADTIEELGQYIQAVEALRADQTKLRALQSTDLITRGMGLVSEDECPLCLTPWDKAALNALLTSRLETASVASSELKRLGETRQEIRTKAKSAELAFRTLAESIGDEFSGESRQLLGYADAIAYYVGQLLVDPVSGALPEQAVRSNAAMQWLSESNGRIIRELIARSADLPSLVGAQQAWDEIVSFERALIELDEARHAEQVARAVSRDLSGLEEMFVAARDEVLQETYDAIADRLSHLYRRLHGPEEDGFAAKFAPTKAGLKLEVDFFGRGAHPPAALHSEGHQDSMGLCLFLALVEHLAGGAIPLVILDDVVMSVDHGHRRGVAEVLRDEFKSMQFILTTHDRVWWRQLQSIGTVKRRGALEIRSWTLEAGPSFVEDASKMLAAAEAALSENDVPRAAHQLRRAVEVHFRDICDGLGAAVRYRGDGNVGAGEFVLAARRRFAELLKGARQAAESWGNGESVAHQMDAKRREVDKAFDEESWAVNPNVHYNEWAQFTTSEFKPVLDAYKALFEMYVCQKCGSTLWITEDGAKPTGVRCSCGDVSLNLLKQVQAV